MADCSDTVNLLENFISNPDLFIEPQREQVSYFEKFAKKLYRLSVKSQNNIGSVILPKLLVDGFDEEQIWQQLELKNGPSIKLYKKQIKSLNPDSVAELCQQNVQSNTAETFDNISSDEEEDIDQGKEYAFDDDDSSIDEDALREQLENNKLKRKTKGIKSKAHYKTHEIDDKFFNLAQLDDVLKLQDIQEQKIANGEISSDESEDDVDYIANLSDEEEKSAKTLMYNDFFDPPESANEGEESNEDNVEDDYMEQEEGMEYDTRDYDAEEEDKTNNCAPKKDLFDDGSSEGEEEKSQAQRIHVQKKTIFEKQREKEQKRIQEMEENLLQPKPWQLTGEVAASNRPENSLMQQPVTFDAKAPQGIVLTEDLTAKLENIIRMAIINKAWCDVERKIKPVDDFKTFKRPEPIDQNKSKKSLAEIYEDEFLKQKYKPEETEDTRHAEIRQLMDQLTPELYALFSHIPKPPVPEIKVVNNLPAITVEEVAPVGLSDAALLAPEEIKKKPKGDVIGDAEKSATDKKRERRKKKLHQKFYHKNLEIKMQKLSATNPALAKKVEKSIAIKKLKQNKNTIIAKTDNSQKIKSSKDFFSRLQETVNKRTIVKTKKK